MKNKKLDYILLGVFCTIIFFGLFIFASAASVTSNSLFFSQIFLGFLPGIVIAYLFFRTPLSLIKKWAPYILFLNIFLLILLFIPGFSETARGSARWIALGPLSFQPSEFLKLTFVLYVASLLTAKISKTKRKSFPTKEVLFPFFVVSVLIAFILLSQPDLSTLVIILSTAFVVYFVAETPLWHSVVLFFTGVIGFFIALMIHPYQLTRVINMFNPQSNPLGSNYQLRQMLIAVGSGGITGLGLGMSQQKFGYLSFPASDSIFAVLAEETGFIGSIIFLLLLLLFFWRGIVIARESKDKFARLVVVGICSWIFIQTSINIGVTIGVFPVTGIPLPFVSYGKSHLLTEMAAIGILLNVSLYMRRK